MNLLGQLGRGAAWTYGGMAISGGLQVFVVAATARLFAPEVFGLMAMANVVLRFGNYFAQMGVGRALIQRADIDDEDVRAAFTSTTLLGALATIAITAIAPLGAAYYQTESVVPVLRCLAWMFLISGLGATSRALLQRRLLFRATSAIDVASYAFGYAIPALVLGANGFGVWSLVAGVLGQTVVSTSASLLLTRHPLAPMLRWGPHARLLRFGASVSGISVLEFLGSSLDTLVVGRFGTAAQLGLYNRAFMLASLPSHQANQGIARVLFPVLSSGRSDPAAFSYALGVATTSAIRLVIPLGIGMGLAAPEIVRVVLGDSWIQAIPLFAILAPTLAIDVLGTFPGQALDAVGRLRWKAIVQAAYAALLGAFLVMASSGSLDLERVTFIMAIAISLRTVAHFAVAYGAGAMSSVVIRQATASLGLSLVLTIALFTPLLALLRRAEASDELVLTAAILLGGCVLLCLFGKGVVTFLRHRRGSKVSN